MQKAGLIYFSHFFRPLKNIMKFRLLKTNKQLNCKSWNKKFLRDKFHMNS